MGFLAMEESEQQAFLRQSKEALGLTWDDLARASGIAPRTLKTYRMPVTSQDYRAAGTGPCGNRASD
jgi:hypothetical protein